MTRKLKRKIKKMIKTMLIIMGSAVTLGYLGFAGIQTLNGEENFAKNLADTVVALAEGKAKTASLKTPVVANDGAIICDSIMQAVRDYDLADGNYTFRVTGNIEAVEETIDYEIELINYYDDMTYSLAEGETSKTVSLGNDTPDERMLVVKYHKNLNIEEGITLTPTVRKKGMYICVLENIYNKGTISMTARGAIAEGENVYLWKNTDGTYEYVPATGATGGLGSPEGWGGYGQNGTNRATGGGGAGTSGGTNAKRGGHGAAGTSYSGGSGGGGAYHCAAAGTYAGGDAQPNGGAGGTGSARTNSTSNQTYASGGAGNSAGAGAYIAKSGNAYGNVATYAENGTGGLLLVYADTLYNEGEICSKGSNVNGRKYSSATRYSGGGGSGGGSVNIFARIVNGKENANATGGISSVNGSGMKYAYRGGNGGNGSTTINEIGSILNYPDKTITLDYSDTYQIEKAKLSYTKVDEIQTNKITLGNVSYEVIEGKNVVSVSSTGKVVPQSLGTAKIKITDTTNQISTYLYVEIINTTKIDVQEGKNFTVALKQNGTVWSYGLNNNGQCRHRR